MVQKVLTRDDASGRLVEVEVSSSGGIPVQIDAGTTFTAPAGFVTHFSHMMPVDGYLVVDGLVTVGP